MAEFLSLEWGNQQLCGVEASLERGRVRISRCFVLAWPEETNPVEQPLQAGRWLKEELKRLHVQARQVLISLPREEAVMRPLDLPDAPDNELPEMVRFQAATKSTVPLDRLLLDYLPVPKQAGAEGRTVLVATISKALSDRIRTVAGAAELELTSIGLGAAAAAELVVREERRRHGAVDEPRLIVVRHGKQVELSIVAKQHLVFAHTTRLAGLSPEQDNLAVVAEMNRSLVALHRTIPDLRVSGASILGTADENPQLADLLAERLNCTVQAGVDPLSAAEVELGTSDVPGSRGSYAAPVGRLVAQLGAVVESVDFLHPRKPVAKKNAGRRLMVIGSAGFLLLVLAGSSWFWSALSGLDKEISDLEGEEAELVLFNKQKRPVVEAAKVIGEWDTRNVHWLDQAREIGESLGGPDQVYLEKLHFAVAPRGPLATLQLSGFAKGRPESERLDRRLVDRNFTVKPHAANVPSKDSEYPYRVEVDLELVESPQANATP